MNQSRYMINMQIPKIEEFDKKFFNAKALIHLGKNISPKIKSSPALVNEIKHFLNSGIKKIDQLQTLNFHLKY